MREIPLDVKRHIANVFVGQIASSVAPAPFGPLRHAFEDIPALAEEARRTLRTLSRVSPEWAEVAGTALATLYMDSSDRPTGRTQGGRGEIVLVALCGPLTVVLPARPTPEAFRAVLARHAGHQAGASTALTSARSRTHLVMVSHQSKRAIEIIALCPPLTSLRLVRAPSGGYTDACARRLETVTSLTLISVPDGGEAGELVRRCPSLVQLDVFAQDADGLRRLFKEAAETVRYLTVRKFMGPLASAIVDRDVSDTGAGANMIAALLGDIGSRLDSLSFSWLPFHVAHAPDHRRCWRGRIIEALEIGLARPAWLPRLRALRIACDPAVRSVGPGGRVDVQDDTVGACNDRLAGLRSACEARGVHFSLETRQVRSAAFHLR